MVGPYVPTLRELKALSDEELIAAYDAHTDNRVASVDFYMAEIRAREAHRQTRQMVRLTWLIAALTFVVTVATIVNVALLVKG